jgi:serine/threonine protein kinase
MPYVVPINVAQGWFPDFEFLAALTPSVQKAAFQVRRKSDGNEFCLKLIAPNYDLDRLGREVLAMQMINHPHVVTMTEYSIAVRGGVQVHYLVENFIAGSDLSAHLAPGTCWPAEKAFPFFAALSDGLSELATHNIVHRDLKPSNIRVRPDGSPVIIDLGLARHLDLPDLTLTGQGAGIGTPKYFAPEQFTGTKHEIDTRTDLFALGILMHEALVGCHPFYVAGMNRDAFRDAVCNGDAYLNEPAFQALPNPWAVLLPRLLAKERSNRPNNAAQVRDILRKAGGIQ